MNQTEDKILDLDDKVEGLHKISNYIKKTTQTQVEKKHTGNLRPHEKTKPSNHEHRQGRKIPSQWHRLVLQEHERKPSQGIVHLY